MSTEETRKIDKLAQEVSLINLTIQGDEKRGIAGLVPMLQQHIIQTQKNSEDIQNMFKEFKRDVVFDYANSFNHVQSDIGSINEGMFSYKKQLDDRMDWTEGRVKVLEEIDKKSTKRHGFITGVAIFIGI